MTTATSSTRADSAISRVLPTPAGADTNKRVARLVGHLAPPAEPQPADRVERVQSPALRELLKLGQGSPDMISLGGGFPDGDLLDAEGMAAAQQRVQADPKLRKIAMGYGATAGYLPLREQFAGLLREKGALDIDAQDVMVTTGSQQAIFLAAAALVNEGDVVLVEEPTYLTALHAFRWLGAKVVGVPTDSGGVRIDALRELIAEHKPKMLYVVPTFSNPTGAVMDIESRRELLAVAVETKTLVLEDAPYEDLFYDEESPPPMLAVTRDVPHSEDYLLHAFSLSKTTAAGMRLGAMTARPGALTRKPGTDTPTGGLLAAAESCKQAIDLHTSTYTQVTAEQHLAMGSRPASLERMRTEYRKRRDAMCDALQRHLGAAIEFERPKGGFFVWARLTGAGGMETNAQALLQRAAAAGVTFLPGAEFYAEPDKADPSTLRLSFSSADAETIDKGVQRLASVLAPQGEVAVPSSPVAALSRGLLKA